MWNRLVQGDVGPAKPLSPLPPCLRCSAPAIRGRSWCRQKSWHASTMKHFVPLFAKAEPALRLGLLTGSTRMRERRALLERLQRGEIDLLIGTHALLEETVVFRHLHWL